MVKIRLNYVLLYFYICSASTTKLLQTKEPINNSFALALSFQEVHRVLPEIGTHVPKLVGEAHVIFVLIKNVHLAGTINGVR
jgi:hypothetical protein